jgi:uncharacterized membrane protein
MRHARRARAVLALGACVWVVGLVLAPRLLFPAGRFICHQRPERSFFVNGTQMPVCARCTGLYAGAALAAPLALILAAPLAGVRARYFLALAAFPTALTWALEFAGLVPFSNAARFVAALPLGFAAAWLVLGALSDDQTPRIRPDRR